jgi:hypothetical protein
VRFGTRTGPCWQGLSIPLNTQPDQAASGKVLATTESDRDDFVQKRFVFRSVYHDVCVFDVWIVYAQKGFILRNIWRGNRCHYGNG